MKKNIASLLAFISCGLPALAYADEPAKETGKTAADIADQALNMLGDAATKMSDMLQKTAPEVWRIMIRQQYTQAAVNVTLATLFLGVSIGLYYSTKKILTLKDHSTYDDEWKIWAKAGVFIALLTTAIIFACNVGFAAGRLINPEYYAIANMIELAKTK